MKKFFTSTLLFGALSFAAFAQAETDCTNYIKNPSFESNGFENWAQSGLQTQSNNDFPKKEGNIYVEKWVSQGRNVGNAQVSQIVTNLPMGVYRLTVGAMNYNQADTEQNCEGAYIFAGDVKETIYTPNDYSLVFSTVSGEVEIGFMAENAKGNWVACDNFRLVRIGDVEYAQIKPELDALISKGEAVDGKMTDQCKNALASALTAAKAVSSATAMDDVQKVITNLSNAISEANESISEFEALDTAIANAEKYAGKKMEASIAKDFNATFEAAKNITTASARNAVVDATNKLVTETEVAAKSADEYSALAAAIESAKKAATADPGEAAATKNTLDAAQAMYDQGSGNSTDIASMIKQLADASLAYRLEHAKGNVPTVTTNPYIARGSRIAFGRMKVENNGTTILEQGFCWAENPNPSVLDERSSEFYNHAGSIYMMKDIKPATKYYVRAYAITTDYQVGYGDAIKVVTLPAANCTWSWERNDATDEEDARCQKACSEAISNYNYCSGFRGFHLSAHYVKGAGAGNGTADCSYGGWMRISQNVPYQRTGTVQHETNHGVGVGTTDRWKNNSDLRADVTRGHWLGRRANELVNFFEDTPGNMTVTGDGTHMWVVNKEGNTSGTLNYGINGAQEDSGYQLLYYANAMLTEYICEDGLNPTYNYHNGMPCYTFDFEEGTKYYLINESEERGFKEGGMLSAQNDKLRWSPTTKVDDYKAWNLEYNYEEGYYSFKNVATGKYLSHNGKSLSYVATDAPSTAEEFQLMPSRIDVVLGSTRTYGYWLTWYASTSNYSLLAREYNDNQGYGVYTGATFLFGNDNTDQRFIIVSEDEIDAFLEKAAGVKSVFAPEEKTVVAIYTIDGVLTNEMRPGINIVRYSDGTAQKILK